MALRDVGLKYWVGRESRKLIVPEGKAGNARASNSVGWKGDDWLLGVADSLR